MNSYDLLSMTFQWKFENKPMKYMKENCLGAVAKPWWRNDMETLSALVVFCEGNPPVTSKFPLQSVINERPGYFLCQSKQNDEQTVNLSII